MNKYIEEIVSELVFEFNDLALGLTYQQIGYATKKEFYKEMAQKVNELYSRLEKEGA